MQYLELFKKRGCPVQNEIAIRGHYGVIDINNMREDRDIIMSQQLFPGVGVIYPSNLRYINAPPDALTVDMFDASLPEIEAAGQLFFEGGYPRMQPNTAKLQRAMQTTTLMREDLPLSVQEKLSTLDVVLGSLKPDRPPTAFCVGVPNVGFAFTTSARWIILTEEDCRVDTP